MEKTKKITALSKYITSEVETSFSIDRSFTSKDFSSKIKTFIKSFKQFDGLIIKDDRGNLYFINLRNSNALTNSSSINISQGKAPNIKSSSPFRKIIKYTLTNNNKEAYQVVLIFNFLDRQSVFPIFKKSLISLLCYFVLSLIILLTLSDSSSTNKKNNNSSSNNTENYAKKEQRIKIDHNISFKNKKKKNIAHKNNEKEDYPKKEKPIKINHKISYQEKEKKQSNSDKEQVLPAIKEKKYQENISSNTKDNNFSEASTEKIETKSASPISMYSNKSGLVWGDFLKDKLDAELKRSTEADQDSCLVFIKIKNPSNKEIPYKEISELIINKFHYQDLAFEIGSDLFCIIIPDKDLNEGQNEIDDFIKLFLNSFTESNFILYAGITSRNGRLVNAEIMITESETALEKAEAEPKSTTIAFRADANKYREWASKKY